MIIHLLTQMYRRNIRRLAIPCWMTQNLKHWLTNEIVSRKYVIQNATRLADYFH